MGELIILNFIVFGLFGFSLAYRVQILWSKAEVYEDVLSKTDSLMLRGIAAVFIIFSHYITYISTAQTDMLGPAKIYIWFGGLGVCIFFFISGYGIETTYKNKDIDFNFLKKRLLNVLPTFCALRFIFGLLEGKWNEGILYIILYTLGIKEPFWFVTEILIIYLLYFWAKKFFNKKHIWITGLFLVLMSFVMWLMQLEPRWYNANLVFVLGMVVAENNRLFIDFFKKHYLRKIFILLMLCLCGGIWYSVEKGSLFANVLKLITGTFFCLFFAVLNLKIRPTSRLIKWIGQKSLYLYVVHLEVWKTYDMFLVTGENDLLVQFMVCLTSSFLFVWVFSKMEHIIEDKVALYAKK